MTSAGEAHPAGGSSSMMAHSHGWRLDAGSSAGLLGKGPDSVPCWPLHVATWASSQHGKKFSEGDSEGWQGFSMPVLGSPRMSLSASYRLKIGPVQIWWSQHESTSWWEQQHARTGRSAIVLGLFSEMVFYTPVFSTASLPKIVASMSQSRFPLFYSLYRINL